jgi:hypothetical protein
MKPRDGLRQLTFEGIRGSMAMWSSTDSRSVEKTKMVLELILEGCLPFAIVEQPSFRRLMGSLAPKYAVPNRKYFSGKALPKYDSEVRARVQRSLDKARWVALSSDMWTSKSSFSFMSLTVHWLTENFEVKHSVLNCEFAPGHHTGEAIAGLFERLLTQWSISTTTVAAALTDHASNENLGVKLAGLPHVHCAVHKLQLCVQDVLRAQTGVATALVLAKSIVKRFSKSLSLTTDLHNLQRDLGMPEQQLVKHCKTRWNTEVQMISRLLEQRTAIDRFNREIAPDTVIAELTAQQWDTLQRVANLLGPVERLTEEWSSRSAHVGMVLPGAEVLYRELRKLEVRYVVALRDALLQALEDRFRPLQYELVYTTAMCLDPRYKFALFRATDGTIVDMNQIDRVRQHILTEMQAASDAIEQEKQQTQESRTKTTSSSRRSAKRRRLPPETESASQTGAVPSASTSRESIAASITSSSSTTTRIRLDEIEDENDNVRTTKQKRRATAAIATASKPRSAKENRKNADYDESFAEAITKNHNVSGNSGDGLTLEAEFQQYLDETPVGSKACPFVWWRSNAVRYPRLRRVAVKYLCIPPGSVESEREFSTAGLVCTAKRNRLAPHTLQRLVFSKLNMYFDRP